MRYLLDVNSLIALGVKHHEFNPRVSAWVRSQHDLTLLTCSITELGFVRVIARAEVYGFNVPQAKELLIELKKISECHFQFASDRNDISSLPPWVNTPKQTTDGHLLELAKAHDAAFATLDLRIPGAHVIPA